VAVHKVLEIGHPMLKQRASEIEPAEIQTDKVQGWIDDLIDTMRHANGAGIAANQIGNPHRIFVAEVKGNNPRYPYKPPIPLTVIVNPQITFLSDATFDNYEGCLSVPNLRGVVERHLEIGITGFDRDGAPLEYEMRGYSAGTFQHEYDHLDGLLFPYRVADPLTFCSWDSFAEFHQEPFAKEVEGLVAKWGS